MSYWDYLPSTGTGGLLPSAPQCGRLAGNGLGGEHECRLRAGHTGAHRCQFGHQWEDA